MSNPVRLVSISRGAEFEVDLSAFSEAEPVFAYVDDVKAGVEVLHGLVVDGRMMIQDRPRFMWLEGPRDCVVLKPNAEGMRDRRTSFRSLGVGEFCLEVYHVRPDQSVVLLHKDEFCFK